MTFPNANAGLEKKGELPHFVHGGGPSSRSVGFRCTRWMARCTRDRWRGSRWQRSHGSLLSREAFRSIWTHTERGCGLVSPKRLEFRERRRQKPPNTPQISAWHERPLTALFFCVSFYVTPGREAAQKGAKTRDEFSLIDRTRDSFK